MPIDPHKYVNRRTALKSFAAGGTVSIAGCVGDDDDDVETDEEAALDPDADENGDEEEEAETDEEEDDQDEDQEDEEDLASLLPAPTGDQLTNEEIETLIEIFDDQPMNEDQLQVGGEI